VVAACYKPGKLLPTKIKIVASRVDSDFYRNDHLEMGWGDRKTANFDEHMR
jgi:hypothetical protein